MSHKPGSYYENFVIELKLLIHLNFVNYFYSPQTGEYGKTQYQDYMKKYRIIQSTIASCVKYHSEPHINGFNLKISRQFLKFLIKACTAISLSEQEIQDLWNCYIVAPAHGSLPKLFFTLMQTPAAPEAALPKGIFNEPRQLAWFFQTYFKSSLLPFSVCNIDAFKCFKLYYSISTTNYFLLYLSHN